MAFSNTHISSVTMWGLLRLKNMIHGGSFHDYDEYSVLVRKACTYIRKNHFHYCASNSSRMHEWRFGSLKRSLWKRKLSSRSFHFIKYNVFVCTNEIAASLMASMFFLIHSEHCQGAIINVITVLNSENDLNLATHIADLWRLQSQSHEPHKVVVITYLI